ncbi:hypothetical protein Tco_0458160 [Tanacetum coccineum]
MSNTNTNLQTQISSVLQNDTVSSCSISKVQEKTQLSRIKCMKSLRAIQSQLKFLTDTLQDFEQRLKMLIIHNQVRKAELYHQYDAQSFYDAMIFNMDSLGKYMLELILRQQRTLHLLKQKTLMQTQEDHSNQTQALNSDSLKVDLVVKQNSCSEKEDSNSETASNKSEHRMQA